MPRLITSQNTEHKNVLKLQKFSVPSIFKRQLCLAQKHFKQRVLTSLQILNVRKICLLTRSIAGHAYAVRQKKRDGTLSDVDFSIKELETIHKYKFISTLIFDMDKRYAISFIGILLFSIGLYNYQDQTSINAEIFCDQQNQFCVSCPNAKQISSPYINERYTYVSYTSQFKILVSKKRGNHFSRINCKYFLRFISRSDFQILSEELNSYFQNQVIELKNSLVANLQMNSNSLKIFNYSDLIVFYKSQEYRSPSIKVHNQSNLDKLLKILRSISWSVLFTLILKALDYKIGLFTSRIRPSFPWMEVIILLYGIKLGNEIHLFFIYQNVSEMMFLAYLAHKLLPHINERLYIGYFCVLCTGSYLSPPIGYVLVFASFYKYTISTKQLLNVIIILTIVVAFLLNVFQTNFTMYACYLWKIIMYPLVFIQFQLPDQQSFNRLDVSQDE